MDAEVVAASGKENNLIADSGPLVVLNVLMLPRAHVTNGYTDSMKDQSGRFIQGIEAKWRNFGPCG